MGGLYSTDAANRLKVDGNQAMGGIHGLMRTSQKQYTRVWPRPRWHAPRA